jgi:hypothetical protein
MGPLVCTEVNAPAPGRRGPPHGAFIFRFSPPCAVPVTVVSPGRSDDGAVGLCVPFRYGARPRTIFSSGAACRDVHLSMRGKTIRIRECGNGYFGLAIIDHDTNKVYDQGLASGALSPQAAYDYAVKCLPTETVSVAKWEYRSDAGVYVDLDVLKLGWAR